MSGKLKILAAGAGFVGQGHTASFRSIGVGMVGIVSRTPHRAIEVADKIKIPYSKT